VIQKRIGEIETDSLALTKLISAYLKAGGGSHVAGKVEPQREHASRSKHDKPERGDSKGRIDAVGVA
jgi:hypothetical protein